MTKYFKRTMDDVELYDKVLDAIVKLGVTLGLDPVSVNPMNAHQRLIKKVNEYIKLEEKAEELGYSSPLMALKALGQVKERVNPVDLSSLPEIFHKVPMVWLRGRPADKKRKEKGFAPMTPGQAKLKHRLLLPLLIRVWAEIAEDEALQNELIEAYLTTSANSFEIDLFAYDEKIEDYCIDETEYIEEPSMAELIRARQAATVGVDSYGVGAGELIAPDWNEGEE
jgi:hypothetical protein